MSSQMSSNESPGCDAPAKPRNSAHAGDARTRQQARDAFEWKLRAHEARRQRCDDEPQPSHAAASDTAASAAGAIAAAVTGNAQPRAHDAACADAAAAPIEATANSARPALEAALNAYPTVPPITGTDPATVWEASLREPNSVAVDMRAIRAEQPAHAQPIWAVAISSPTVRTEILARHAPRLHERLRARLNTSHVRVERDDEEQ
jgi:hypothetical protein